MTADVPTLSVTLWVALAVLALLMMLDVVREARRARRETPGPSER